eukprot:6206796-Pleurochrysis_carterae.AAC.1
MEGTRRQCRSREKWFRSRREKQSRGDGEKERTEDMCRVVRAACASCSVCWAWDVCGAAWANRERFIVQSMSGVVRPSQKPSHTKCFILRQPTCELLHLNLVSATYVRVQEVTSGSDLPRHLPQSRARAQGSRHFRPEIQAPQVAQCAAVSTPKS